MDLISVFWCDRGGNKEGGKEGEDIRLEEGDEEFKNAQCRASENDDEADGSPEVDGGGKGDHADEGGQDEVASEHIGEKTNTEGEGLDD